MEQVEIKIEYNIVKIEELSSDFQKIITEAKRQTSMAYSPYSNFNVGAAVLLDNGQIVSGNNQENVAFPAGLCAERIAMFHANSQYPDKKPLAIAIAAKNENGFLEKPICPCGNCRQALLESELRYKSHIKVILYGSKDIFLINSISDMLPFAFASIDR